MRLSGDHVVVSGWVQGGESPTLTVAGEAVVPDANGDFSVEVPLSHGINTLVAQARDNATQAEDRRSVLVGATADPNAEVEALSVFMSEQGLQDVSELLTVFANELELRPYFEANMPEGVTLTALEHGEIRLALRPREDHLNVRLEVDTLHVGLSGVVDLGIEITFSGTGDADPLEVETRVDVFPTPDGSLGLDVLGASVVLRNFEYDIPFVPEFAEGWFEDTVRNTIQTSIADAVRMAVIAELFDPAALTRAVTFGEQTVEMRLGITDVDMSRAGVSVQMDASATVADPVLQARTLPPLGGMPSHQGQAPLDVAFSLDFINRILHGAWSTGALDLNLELGGEGALPPLNVGSLRNALGSAAEGIPPETPVVIQTRPLLAPMASLVSGDRPLHIVLPELLLEVSAAGEVLVLVSLHIDAGVALDAEDLDASDGLSSDLQIEVLADVVSTPRGPVNVTQTELFSAQLAQSIASMIADQVFTQGDDALPIPLSLSGGPASADAGSPWLHLIADQIQ